MVRQGTVVGLVRRPVQLELPRQARPARPARPAQELLEALAQPTAAPVKQECQVPLVWVAMLVWLAWPAWLGWLVE
jgi:hypothetical protein